MASAITRAVARCLPEGERIWLLGSILVPKLGPIARRTRVCVPLLVASFESGVEEVVIDRPSRHTDCVLL